MEQADVTICIPAWNAADFIRTAVESAIAQTHAAIRIVISVDLGDDDTAAICRGYDDPRIEVIEQPERLGWVGNVNALLDQVETPFFCFLFHDDSIAPDYVGKLHTVLGEHREAVAASSGIRFNGGTPFVQNLQPVRGTLFERLRAIVAVRDSFHSLKALHRSDAVRGGLRLEDNRFSGFQADVPFMMAMAAHGEYLVVDACLYEKKVWGGSVTGGWRQWPPDRFLVALATAAAARIRVVQACTLTTAEKCALTELILNPRAPRLTEAADFAEHLQRYPMMFATAVISELSGMAASATDLESDSETARFRRIAMADRAGHVARQALARGESQIAFHYAALAARNEKGSGASHAVLAQSLLALEPSSRAQLARRAVEHAETARRLAPRNTAISALVDRARARLWMSGPRRFALMPFKPLLLRIWRWRHRQRKE